MQDSRPHPDPFMPIRAQESSDLNGPSWPGSLKYGVFWWCIKSGSSPANIATVLELSLSCLDAAYSPAAEPSSASRHMETAVTSGLTPCCMQTERLDMHSAPWTPEPPGEQHGGHLDYALSDKTFTPQPLG